jgi:hypothetical protein
MNEYSKRLIELHILANRWEVEEEEEIEIDNKYKLFWKEYESLSNKTDKFLSDGVNHLSLHDSQVENLSEKKDPKGIYHTTFEVFAFVYNNKKELGTQKMQITFESKIKCRDLNNSRIYDFVIDEDKKEMNIIFFKERFTNINFLNIKYSTINKDFINTTKRYRKF